MLFQNLAHKYYILFIYFVELGILMNIILDGWPYNFKVNLNYKSNFQWNHWLFRHYLYFPENLYNSLDNFFYSATAKIYVYYNSMNVGTHHCIALRELHSRLVLMGLSYIGSKSSPEWRICF